NKHNICTLDRGPIFSRDPDAKFVGKIAGTGFVGDGAAYTLGRYLVLLDQGLHQNAAHFSCAEYGDATLRKIGFHFSLRSGGVQHEFGLCRNSPAARLCFKNEARRYHTAYGVTLRVIVASVAG